MYPILKERWLLCLCLLLFLLFKLPDLTIAFYWDESWVYAPGASLMYAHGPSLMPDAIPVEYSRGHPMLFLAMCAGWMDVFGQSHVAMHSFSLFISVVLVVVVYEVLLRLFNKQAALTGMALLLLNHIFYVESSSVLNDVMLGLWFLLVIYFYTVERYLLVAVFLTLTFYTKESGLVIGCIIGADILSDIVRKKNRRQILYKMLCVAVPLLLIALFFIIQRVKVGWFFNPEHTGLLNYSIANTFEHFSQTINLIFYKESNFFFWSAILLLSLIAAAMKKKPKYLLLLVPSGIICLALMFSPEEAVFYCCMSCFIAITIILLWMPMPRYTSRQQHFLKLTIATSVAYIYFCCINFFEQRYLFPAVLLVSVVLAAVLCSLLLDQMKSVAFVSFFCVLVAGGIGTFALHNGELTIRERIKLQQDLIDYFEANNFYNKHIFCYPYLQRMHLSDQKTGFLHSSRFFRHVSYEFTDSTELMIFDYIEENAPNSEALRHRDDFYLLHRIEKGDVWVEVYKRK